MADTKISDLTTATTFDAADVAPIVQGGVNKKVTKAVIEAGIAHANISGVGTNAHSVIDSHLASTANPHSVTKTQVGLSNVVNADTTTTANITDSTNKRFLTDAQLVVVGNTSGTNTGDQTNVSGYAESLKSATTTVVVSAATAPTSGQVLTASSGTAASWVNPTTGVTDHTLLSNIGTNTHATIDTHLANTSNPHSVTKTQIGLGSVVNADTTTTANITDSTNKRFITDAQQTVLGNTSGTNTGDQSLTALALKATLINTTAPITGGGDLSANRTIAMAAATTSVDGYLTSTDWNTFNGKQAAGSYVTSLTGDITGSGPGATATTLATVNSNVGSFTYSSVTVNAKGLVTAASSGTEPISAVLTGYTSGAGTVSSSDTILQAVQKLNGNDALYLLLTGGTLTGKVIPSVFTLTDAATIAVDASLGNQMTVTLGGNRTLGNPTNPVAGQLLMLAVRQDATGSRTLAYDTAYRFGTDITAITLTTTAAKTDYIGFRYNGTDSKWDVISVVKGY